MESYIVSDGFKSKILINNEVRTKAHITVLNSA